MRHPVRPFITAYKGRSAKSAGKSLAAMAASVEEPKPKPKPAPLLFEEPGSAPASQDEAYLAALRAADALFGRLGGAPAAAQQSGSGVPAPASPSPVGRILPSLLEEPRPPIRIEEEPVRRRGRKKRDAEAIDHVPAAPPEARRPRGRPRAVKAEREPAAIEAPDFAAAREPAPSEEIAALVVGLAAPAAFAPSEESGGERRARRILQQRWVLKTELRPGEKWKRRLRGAAR